ncbi:phage tail protein [Candidatus Dojkabacteria bacterium]|jgi:hypothetical protein|nr:phage tail protein [Candidatus Dojkabacteria bacterium]
MAFSVNDFRSQMVGDGARPNLFEVSMPFPGFSAPGNAQTKLTFMAKTAQLPASTVNAVPVNYFGRELKFAGNRTFTDWVITVINDEDFVVRNAFERWLNGINSHNLNIRTPIALPPIGYTVDGEVIQYGKTGNTLKKYKFIGLFPTDVSQIDVDWGANDQIEEFTVTLSYQWWESVADGVV